MVEQELKFYTLDKLSYLKFRDEIVELYYHAFTTGELAQHLTRSSVEETMDEMMKFGHGVILFIDNILVGMLVATPLSEHHDYTFDSASEIEEDKTIYINELMVHSEYRGRGLAKKILQNFLNTISNTVTNAASNAASDKYLFSVIRVWEKNIPALSLYRKFGFEPFARITQTKLDTSGHKFQMNKIYLYKILNN